MVDRLTRIWIVARKDPAGGAAPELPEGLAAAVTLAPSEAPPRPEQDGAAALAAWLGELAARHLGREIVLLAEVDLVRAAAAAALSVPSAVVVAHSVTLDWSASGEPPQLIGVDLDWKPPFQPAGRAKFPGGPGVAGSARG